MLALFCEDNFDNNGDTVLVDNRFHGIIVLVLNVIPNGNDEDLSPIFIAIDFVVEIVVEGLV